MERAQRFSRMEMMRVIYISLIFVSVVFNGLTQSYAYEAWKSGIPLDALVEAKGNVDEALLMLSPSELSEIRTS